MKTGVVGWVWMLSFVARRYMAVNGCLHAPTALSSEKTPHPLNVT
jgi:hypothetical protein